MFRRKHLPSSLTGPHTAFQRVVERLERAKAVVIEAVPTARRPGRPLADALAEFEAHLHEAEGAMDGWRDRVVEAEWRAARAGLQESLRLAEELRLEAPDPIRFESLVGAIGDLIAPLEAFEAAEGRFRDSRT